jgi:iron complex transport system substrate-binding protein
MSMRVLSHRLPAVVAVTAVAALCAACGTSTTGNSGSASAAGGTATAAGSFPVTIAAAGGPVRVKSRPATIVSLSPTATEMLYAIGAGSQVKAVDADSDYPAQAPRTKLSGLQPNVESIVAYKPDLVVVSFDATALAKRLATFSIPVLDLPAPSGLSGMYSEFDQLGQATGHLATAEGEDAALRGQISKIVAQLPRRTKPLTYYYELDQTYYSITSSTFVGSLLKLLGMKSIADSASGAAAAGGYPQLSSEYIIKANPDYIILADTVCCQQSAATVAKRPGWSSLAAVKAGHIILLNDDIASRWGPRVADLLRTVVTAVAKGSGQ